MTDRPEALPRDDIAQIEGDPERERYPYAKKIHPVGARLLVRPPETESKSPGGLWILSSTREQMVPVSGTIVARGPDVDADEFEPGQIVVFGRHAGSRVSFGLRGEENYIVLMPSDILCIVEE